MVKEATPTAAGLQLIPLMGGLLLTSIISGRIISRTGKYRLFPILGTLLGVTGMALLDPHYHSLAAVAAVPVYRRAGERVWGW